MLAERLSGAQMPRRPFFDTSSRRANGTRGAVGGVEVPEDEARRSTSSAPAQAQPLQLLVLPVGSGRAHARIVWHLERRIQVRASSFTPVNCRESSIEAVSFATRADWR